MIETLRAHAKLTLSLRVVGVRDDGYHEIDAEMISLDVHDVLTIDTSSTGISMSGPFAAGLSSGEDNLVAQALKLCGVDAHVHVTGGGGEAGFRTRVPAPLLGRYTSSGVTTVVGLLGTDDTTRGPRELLAGIYALREEGLSAWGWVGGYHVPPVTLTGSAGMTE